MNHRITGNHGSPAVSSGVGGLLLALCLNMAILPCAMAFGADDQACPHTSSAEQHGTDGHHGHGAGHAKDHAEQPGADCHSAGPSCCDLAVASVDTRSVHVKFKPSFDDQPWLASANPNRAQSVARYAIAPAADPPDSPGTSVPRHVLFCIYLD